MQKNFTQNKLDYVRYVGIKIDGNFDRKITIYYLSFYFQIQ